MKIVRRISILVKKKHLLNGVQRNENPSKEIIICPYCGEMMSDAENTARILGTSVRKIYRMVEKGEIHFFENEAQICFMCPKSFDSDTKMQT